MCDWHTVDTLSFRETKLGSKFNAMRQDGVRTPKAKVRGSNPLGCANDFNGLGVVCVRQRVWNSRELDVNDSPTVVTVWHTADTAVHTQPWAASATSIDFLPVFDPRHHFSNHFRRLLQELRIIDGFDKFCPVLGNSPIKSVE